MPQRVIELHNIMPLANIPSVMQHGILSNARVVRLKHFDISMQAIQERRDKIQVPHGLKLHRYANLYFHARNPMLYKRLEEANNLCILRVNTTVLGIPGTVITDQNASSNYVRFLAPADINQLELDRIFAEDWRHHDNPIDYFRHKSQKCAEILVPHVIPPDYIVGAYVVTEKTQEALANTGFSHPIEINSYLFFK